MSGKVLTPAEVASIKARRFAGDMPKVLDSHEALRAELTASENLRSHHIADLDDRDATITRLRGLIEGMGHEAGCASRRWSGALGEYRPHPKFPCNCILSKVNL